MPLYDYRCEQGHVTELRKGMECSSIPCLQCGQAALRIPFYVSQVIITETGMGSGYGRYRPVGSEVKDRNGRVRLDLFHEATEELDYAHKRKEEAVGHELPNKPYYKMGMERAKQLSTKGS